MNNELGIDLQVANRFVWSTLSSMVFCEADGCGEGCHATLSYPGNVIRVKRCDDGLDATSVLLVILGLTDCEGLHIVSISALRVGSE
jgi:hypothetical protein